MHSGRQYLDGREVTFGADGRWWWVTEHRRDGEYGYPVSNQILRHHRPGHGHASASHHHQNGSGPQHIESGMGALQTGSLGDRYGSGVDDPWQGNSFARELFQGQGAKYFVGADRLVTNVAEVYAAAYTAAFFAPELLASGQFIVSASRVGVLGSSAGRIFWSGGFLVAGLRAAARRAWLCRRLHGGEGPCSRLPGAWPRDVRAAGAPAGP